MSKLLNVLSFGTVIGAIVYGAIKYRQDEKFKEKVDKAADKTAEIIKDKTEKVVTKAADFTAKHPMLSATAFFGSLAFCRVMRNRQLQRIRQEYYPRHDDYEILPAEECEPTEEIFSNWDEKYFENWKAVNEFANHLNLYSGESFIIEDPAQFNIDSENPIVSHLINGDGCYPPESRHRRNHFIS